MRCKKHPSDSSSSVGVCASCLRERLLSIIAAQAHKQAHKPDPQQHPPPLSFPRSVSPYISRRKSDTSATCHHRFHSTPHVGPTDSLTVEIDHTNNKSRKGGRGGRFSSLFLGLFRSKSDKTGLDSGPIPDSVKSSPSWIFPGRRKKQARTFSIDEASIGGAHRRTCRNIDRGMSPARFSDEEEDEQCRGGSSGYSSESSQGWRQTPRRTAAAAARRRVAGRNVAGLAFCLSPLVRASPNRGWNQKGIPPAEESRVPAKPHHLSYAASFCKNRSRKLADFGRYSHNSNY